MSYFLVYHLGTVMLFPLIGMGHVVSLDWLTQLVFLFSILFSSTVVYVIELLSILVLSNTFSSLLNIYIDLLITQNLFHFDLYIRILVTLVSRVVPEQFRT